MKALIEIFWLEDEDGFLAIDNGRAGCSAIGATEEKALKELVSARKAWDAAKRKAEASA